MTKLHKIMMRHFAPKDSKDGIVLYVLANDEMTIFEAVDNLNNDHFGDMNEGEDEPQNVYDEEGEITGKETRKERFIRLRGDYNDEYADTSDAYYGVTHYGWDAGVEISEADAAVLLRLDIAEDWREG